MNELFEGRHAVSTPESRRGPPNAYFEAPSVMPSAKTATMFVQIVVRSNGSFEVLKELFSDESEAIRDAEWFGSRLQGVQVRVVRVQIPVEF